MLVDFFELGCLPEEVDYENDWGKENGARFLWSNTGPCQAAAEGPSLKNFEVFDPPDIVFLDHGEKRWSNLTMGAQEVNLNHRSMILQ